MTPYAHETPNRGLSLLGMVASGDLGGITCYRSHLGRIVQFAKTYPAKPASLAQLTGRARMNFGAEQWTKFQPVNKTNWRLAAQRLNLSMTGYNLWQQWYHQPHFINMRTLEYQSGVPLYTSIDETEPHWPANVKIQPAYPSNPPAQGIVRYARPFTVTQPGTTLWLPFCACHYRYAIGEPIGCYFTTYGPGYYEVPDMLNRMWCYVKFEAHNQPAQTDLELHAIFDDASEDRTKSTIVTRFPWTD
jgi:hypothetical protein